MHGEAVLAGAEGEGAEHAPQRPAGDGEARERDQDSHRGAHARKASSPTHFVQWTPGSAGTITAVSPEELELTLDDGRSITSDVLVCTAPVAQSFSLLFETVDGLPRDLFDADYDRTLGILAALDSDPGLPEPGAVRDPSADVSMVVDNARKGVSPIHAITLHASAAWSEAHWDDDPDDLEEARKKYLLSEVLVSTWGYPWVEVGES